MAARAAHSASSLPDGRVLVAGGCTVDGCGTASAETFVVAAAGRSVLRGPRLAEARDSHTASVLPDGRVALVGGFPGEGSTVLDSVEVIDVVAGDVKIVARLRQPRGGHASAVLPDGRLLVVGGWIAPRTYTSSTEIVDVASGRVIDGPALPVAVDALDAVALPDGRVVVTGGQRRPGVGSKGVFVYDPAAGRWARGPTLRTARFKHVSVALPGGRVLVAGGTTNDRDILDTTEVVDLARARVSSGPRLVEPRYKMTGGAVRIADGRIVLGGGGRSVEVLELARRRSTAIARFTQRGSFATVNPIGSRSVLVIGGYDDRIALRRTARLVAVPARSR